MVETLPLLGVVEIIFGMPGRCGLLGSVGCAGVLGKEDNATGRCASYDRDGVYGMIISRSVGVNMWKDRNDRWTVFALL